jgi:predicted ArsR family transcriptional regulator
MPAEAIQPEARRFIAEYITSVAQLEMLLLLRTNPQQEWSVEELSRELRIEPAWASSQLRNLCDAGLLHCEEREKPTYCYRPRTAELDGAAAAVAQAYLLHRVSVVELIYSDSNSTIRAFADAFKLRKDSHD